MIQQLANLNILKLSGELKFEYRDINGGTHFNLLLESIMRRRIEEMVKRANGNYIIMK